MLLYNTLTRRHEEFVPLIEGEVGMYACGPTIYATPHIGNMRTFFFADLLHRYLEFRGYRVKFVMNLTDVDDKTITRALQNGVPLTEYTEPFAESLFADFDTLGIQGADVYTRATRYIPEMISLIQRLIDRGLAYVSDGSVYFDISEFPGYGRLSRVDLTQARQGERVASDEYDKDDIRDFALWKAVREEDEAVGAVWMTPWGPGRPGWHIECSAMSMAILGETFDIHCGGADLVFPHHEDEIAQSEGATGKPFVRYWLHGEFLQLDGEKMAKSRGNLFTLGDLLDRGARASSIRHTFLTTHYRGRLSFTWAALAASAEAVRRLFNTWKRLRDHPSTRTGRAEDVPVLHEAAAGALANFTAAMDDDLNTSVALASLYDFVTIVNTRLDALCTAPISAAEASAALDAFARIDAVFGILTLAEREQEEVADDRLRLWVEERIQARAEARARRDFAEADRVRDELTARGIVVEDTVTGARWSVRCQGEVRADP
ncbi:MAG: cysteine--tRNA ligase [Gemmatimonadota bacterium]|jgi:cysteinyl-tRNA synthetase|nr:cysteine--tRNA ligase [Gemmatimonadota bacterium]